MKKYGQADLMCFLVHVYLTENTSLVDDEKKQIEDKCCSEIMKNYPSAMDMEVGK